MAALPTFSSLLKIVAALLETLHSPLPTDAIRQCPPSALHLLPTRPAALIKLSHSKIHSFPFSEVPLCWRRLYTDASIAEGIRIIKSASKQGNAVGACGEEDWIQDVVRLLDMAIILAGAPGRESMIEKIFAALQDFIMQDEDASIERPKKKRRLDYRDCFPESNHLAIPVIQYPVPKRSNISIEGFDKHLEAAEPIVIRDALSHWPALDERPWRSPVYLLSKTLNGRRLVPVEMGRSYTDEGWGQSIITFKEFLDRYMLRQPLRNVDETDRKDREKEDIGYLAQHDLFTQIPSLRSDISIPDFCYTDPPPPAAGTPMGQKEEKPRKLEQPLVNAWFGPAETVSPLHTDPYHNILCQVVGKKYVRLYSPFETSKLYPKGIESGGVDMSNTSEVDVEGNQSERGEFYPLFKDAPYVETVLEAGECLYVPVGWWHYIRSLSVSFSVSFWWN